MAHSSMRSVPLESIAGHPAHRAARIPSRWSCLPCPEAAEHAGFRSCRRCHPEQGRRSPQSELVRRVCREITADANSRADLGRLTAATGLSAHHLQRTFRKAMGITPRQYADAIRVARLKSDLRKGIDVTTALYEAGYGSASRLYERSDAQLGMTPAAYRRGGRGMKISYTVSDCSLGRVLVATTDRGISAISLGDNDSRIWRRSFARNIRTPRFGAARASPPGGCARSSGTLPARNPGSTCRPMWWQPRSSGACGRPCGPFRPALRAHIAKLRASSASPARREPWLELAPQIPLPSWCRVIG